MRLAFLSSHRCGLEPNFPAKLSEKLPRCDATRSFLIFVERFFNICIDVGLLQRLWLLLSLGLQLLPCLDFTSLGLGTDHEVIEVPPLREGFRASPAVLPKCLVCCRLLVQKAVHKSLQCNSISRSFIRFRIGFEHNVKKDSKEIRLRRYEERRVELARKSMTTSKRRVYTSLIHEIAWQMRMSCDWNYTWHK